MKKMRKLAAAILVIVMVCSLLPMTATAASASGTFGNNLTWSVKDGVLTISGSGTIPGSTSVPWEKDNNYIKSLTKTIVIEEGITNIESIAFNFFPGVTAVYLPASLTTMGMSIDFFGKYQPAFGECYDLKNVYFAGTQAQWNAIKKSDTFPGAKINYQVPSPNQPSAPTPTPTPAPANVFTKEAADAYRGILSQLKANGTARYSKSGSSYELTSSGFAGAFLVDFNGDKIPELYTLEYKYMDSLVERIHTWKNGQAVLLSEKSNSVFGNRPDRVIVYAGGKAYLKGESAGGSWGGTFSYTEYFGYDGSSFGNMWTGQYNSYDNGTITCTVTTGGKTYDLGTEHYGDKEKEWLGTVTDTVDVCSSGYGSAYVAIYPGSTKVYTDIDEAVRNAPVTALVTTQKFEADGVKCNLGIYNINNYNYFKLRDIAALCMGTDKEFSVGYDSASGTITLTTGGSYKLTANDLKPGNGENKTTTASQATIIIDGKKVALTAYNIDGYTYYQLRELCKALDIGVTWDAATSTMGIDTTKGY